MIRGRGKEILCRRARARARDDVVKSCSLVERKLRGEKKKDKLKTRQTKNASERNPCKEIRK